MAYGNEKKYYDHACENYKDKNAEKACTMLLDLICDLFQFLRCFISDHR